MTEDTIIHYLGLAGSFAMPFFNIPLILHMIRRKSSADLSLVWALGVWVCILLMTPAAFVSRDMVLKVFGITNVIFFSLVVFFALRYRLTKRS